MLITGIQLFAIIHSSQPKFTVPEIIPDIHRAVRFIRYNSKDFNIDPERIGITGISSGGHLALMVATGSDNTSINSKDPIDKVSSKVQAVACFFPPTDFINWKSSKGNVRAISAPFDYSEWDSTAMVFRKVTDEAKQKELFKDVSPIFNISNEDPPVFIVHGDSDEIVHLSQSENFVQKLKEAKVPVEFIIKKGAGHGWENMENEIKTIVKFFNNYLK